MKRLLLGVGVLCIICAFVIIANQRSAGNNDPGGDSSTLMQRHSIPFGLLKHHEPPPDRPRRREGIPMIPNQPLDPMPKVESYEQPARRIPANVERYDDMVQMLSQNGDNRDDRYVGGGASGNQDHWRGHASGGVDGNRWDVHGSVGVSGGKGQRTEPTLSLEGHYHFD
jgi:hypothetical protein